MNVAYGLELVCLNEALGTQGRLAYEVALRYKDATGLGGDFVDFANECS